MRLIIAIKLNSEIRNVLADVQQRLIRRGIRGNYTNTDNLHITLAFISLFFLEKYRYYCYNISMLTNLANIRRRI